MTIQEALLPDAFQPKQPSAWRKGTEMKLTFVDGTTETYRNVVNWVIDVVPDGATVLKITMYTEVVAERQSAFTDPAISKTTARVCVYGRTLRSYEERVYE